MNNNPFIEKVPYKQFKATQDIFLDKNGRTYYLNNTGDIVPTIDTLKYYNPNIYIGNKLDMKLKGAIVDRNNLKMVNSGTILYQKNDGSISLQPGEEEILKDNDGAAAFKNALNRQKSNKPLKQIYPEFDIISFGQMFKSIPQLFKRLQMTKSYTGVPAHFVDGTGKLKTETFQEYNGIIWSTPSKGAAEVYSQGGIEDGKVFTIFGNTRKLAKLPKTDYPFFWNQVPYKFNNGKFTIDPTTRPYLFYDYFNTKNGMKRPIISITDNGINALRNYGPYGQHVTTNTDMLLQHAIKNKYNGIIIKNVYDGATHINGKYYDLPITDIVYKNADGILKFDKDVTKFDILQPYLPKVLSNTTNIGVNNLMNKNEQ